VLPQESPGTAFCMAAFTKQQKEALYREYILLDEKAHSVAAAVDDPRRDAARLFLDTPGLLAPVPEMEARSAAAAPSVLRGRRPAP